MSPITKPLQETPIADCGEDFSDVEDSGIAQIVFTANEYFDVLDLLAWIGQELMNEEDDKRKDQYKLADHIIRKKRVRPIHD